MPLSPSLHWAKEYLGGDIFRRWVKYLGREHRLGRSNLLDHKISGRPMKNSAIPMAACQALVSELLIFAVPICDGRYSNYGVSNFNCDGRDFNREGLNMTL